MLRPRIWAFVFGISCSHSFVRSQCTSDDPLYKYSYSPMAKLTFYWSLADTTISAKLKYTGTDTVWVAVGPSKSGTMANSEVVLGTASAEPKKYSLTSSSGAGVAEMPAARQTLTSSVVTVTASATEMAFVKLLEEANENTILASGETILVFAYGPAPLAYHGKNRVAVSLDLGSCEAKTLESKTMNKFSVFCHAFLMIGAWLYLVPAGILSAVYKAQFNGGGGGGWLSVHKTFNAMAVASALCGFGVIYLTVDEVGADHFSRSVSAFGRHTLLGGVALVAGCLQVASGVFRPHNPEPGEKKPGARVAFEYSHKFLGYATLALAVLAVLSGVDHADGLSYVDSGTPYYVAAGIPLGLFAGARVLKFLFV
mmetsp:Transcript_43556/g.88083  ORF Transcript_43556/g.88083 Transcript_43556/m.88083 type:complete len:369 (+) Transcript_43556:94-1200(+)